MRFDGLAVPSLPRSRYVAAALQRSCPIFALMLLWTALSALAQTGQITGVVKDPQQAAVAGAEQAAPQEASARTEGCEHGIEVHLGHRP